MKSIIFLVGLILLSPFVLADVTGMMGYGKMGYGMGLYGLAYFVLASFIFSVIFWATRNWFVKGKKK
ncbi:hypothetical protein CMO93_02575 [Candidatus Woesearchaeota archaeon]|nr:hypothetical protein [Candidatus Woesearchaeota archaeon]|tara:strand:- start:6257 stop:6457 length:201 start_codon:yes stop_codon:yes gene_type:complete